MNGGVPSKELNENSPNILGQPENDSNIQNITSLSGAEADPNIQNQAGKTLLHYVAERNDIGGIKFLLRKGADPNVKDQDGKAPFEYATEDKCRQALKGLSDDLDNSRENEGNAEDEGYGSGDDNQTVPTKNKGNLTNDSSNYPNKHNDDQVLCGNNQIISTKPSDCDQEDKDSSCSSSSYLFLEDSLLAKLEIPLTTDEQEVIDEFCNEIRGINEQESEESILKNIEKIVDEYLTKGIRLNSSCSNDNENDKGDKETVTNLILEEINNVLRICPQTKKGVVFVI